VGGFECEECVCDVDRSGSIVASDALAVLRRAVGQQVTLTCLACLVEAEIGPAGGEITSADGRITIVFPAGAVDQATTVSIQSVPLSELPDPAGSAEDGDAYRVGPDALVLGVPAEVSAHIEGALVEGAIGGYMGLLLGAAGGQLEVLANQAMFVDGDDGDHVASADLDTLAPIGVFAVDVRIAVRDVPETAVIDAVHAITAEVIDDDEAFAVNTASYTDDDFGVWQPADGGAIVDAQMPKVVDVLGASFDYKCTGGALVAYRPTIEVVYDLLAGDFQVPGVTQRTTVEKTIGCGS
jgi:hypothetical protein